jgi:hypothetical protein
MAMTITANDYTLNGNNGQRREAKMSKRHVDGLFDEPGLNEGFRQQLRSVLKETNDGDVLIVNSEARAEYVRQVRAALEPKRRFMIEIQELVRD